MSAAIVGWAHTPFGKQDAETIESLIVRVTTDALVDAGITADQVDEIVLGHFNAGFSAQDFTASLVLQADPALRFKPAPASRMPAPPAPPPSSRACARSRPARPRSCSSSASSR